VSIGGATVLSCDVVTMRAPEYLLAAADHLLYKAKKEGRNRVATAVEVAQTQRCRPSRRTSIASPGRS
jgi:hypothetical protein